MQRTATSALALLLLVCAPAVTGAQETARELTTPGTGDARPGDVVPAVPAAPPAPALNEHPQSEPKNTGVLLWKVTSSSATVYLLGSIHVASADLYPLDPRIRNAFHASSVLVTELDVSPVGKEQSKRLLEVYGTYPQGDSLDRHIDASTRQALERIIEERKDSPELSDIWKMRPWYAYLTLTNVALAAAGYKAEWGIEEHLRRMAGRKKVETLETMLDQVAIFRDMPEEAQLASLEHAVRNMHELPAAIQRAQDAWKRGDGERITDLVVEPLRRANPMLYDRLFTQRNRKMTEAVERYLSGTGTYFVVVGSGHLLGRDSILAMLAEKGHRAVQL
ncbi:MAG TPA: TraB/GumN family protein [Candidatus Limnocylindrales bacterium]|nr:TraB/GumN family protein [Candidatus Limnocylindrales bacterium]